MDVVGDHRRRSRSFHSCAKEACGTGAHWWTLVFGVLGLLVFGCASEARRKVEPNEFRLRSADSGEEFVLVLPRGFRMQTNRGPEWVMYHDSERHAKAIHFGLWVDLAPDYEPYPHGEYFGMGEPLPLSPPYDEAGAPIYSFSSHRDNNRLGVYIGHNPVIIRDGDPRSPDPRLQGRRVYTNRRGGWEKVTVFYSWGGRDFKSGLDEFCAESIIQCAFDTNLFVHIFWGMRDYPERGKYHVYPADAGLKNWGTTNINHTDVRDKVGGGSVHSTEEHSAPK